MGFVRRFVLVFLMGAGVGYLFGGDPANSSFNVIKKSTNVEKYLKKYKETMGAPDYERYRGHVYRVLNIALSFLTKQDVAKHRRAIETALVFHDIALWSANELNYLSPSLAEAKKVVSDLSESEMRLMSDIIMEHHKLTPFTGENEEVVNAVIRADLADFSFGMVRSGFSRDDMAKLRHEIPDTGFHLTLMSRITSIRGYAGFMHGCFEVGQIFRM
eukprot:TRINITY_DN5753_c0_g3_i1.p1 TRINITY_DN5753_c0_g3~~TRINITY_DN5753_c0_g3_i1.p1  ORF type:complete len:216 (-),score=34.55 TRINITY_DN5753_c0_g3_i1:186-833(-)